FSGLNLAVLVGLATAYDDPCLWSILTEDGRRAARHAAGLDVVGLVLEHPEPLAAYTTRAEPWDEPAWCRVLARERNGVQAPAVPTYVYHVTDDEIVPAWLGRELARTYRVQGTDVTWVEVPATDHLHTTRPTPRSTGSRRFVCGVTALSPRDGADGSGARRPICPRPRGRRRRR
ncbi:MAG TPA: hypothetical protein PL137_17175, partial [Nocardioides sp.]|nr:hypothetical protein [Nocardioides sp.]